MKFGEGKSDLHPRHSGTCPTTAWKDSTADIFAAFDQMQYLRATAVPKASHTLDL